MSFTVVIPARYQSSRLPAKPLRDIHGKTMIQRVYEQALLSNASRVIIATDDQRIADMAASFGGDCTMTSPDHESGTDRLQEVAQLNGFADDEIVVNVQGDEPLIPPEVINQVADNLAANAEAGVATLAEPISSDEDFRNPNIVKAVFDQAGLAMYFSRAPIPWPRDFAEAPLQGMKDVLTPMRHIGIYAYRVAQLNQFVQWPMAPVESLECLEQLRFLWNGSKIHVAVAVQDVPGGVDTEEDLQRVIALLKEN